MSRFPGRAVFAISEVAPTNLCGMHSHKVYYIRRVFVDDVNIHFIHTTLADESAVVGAHSLELKTTSLFSLKHDCRNQKAQVFKSISGDKKASERRER
jgi:hypothetical protein